MGSRSKSNKVTKGIYHPEHLITIPTFIFLKHLVSMSTKNPLLTNHDSPQIKSFFPIFKTSASKDNWSIKLLFEKIWNNVWTMKFPTERFHLLPCLILTFLALFQTPIFFANLVTTTDVLGVQSILASTSSPTIKTWTVKREAYLGVYPIYKLVLPIHFLTMTHC